jgi:ADP-ribosylglycohydrolase
VYNDILSRIFYKPDCLSIELSDASGYIVDALTIAIWGLYNYDNFEEGMLEILKLGGDTDTNCAIYGQLAGAYYGVENIPERWLGENLYESEGIESMAENLLKMGEVKVLRTRFEEDKKW